MWLIADTATGYSILEFTTLVSLDVSNAGEVLSEPIEQGTFATYNKYREPVTVDVTLGIEGDATTIQDTIETLEYLQESPVTFSLVTPEYEYSSMTLESFSYRRSSEDGLFVLYPELHLVEVREVAPQYTSAKVITAKGAKKPDAVSAQDRGKTQTQEPNKSLAVKGKEALGNMLSWGGKK